MATVVLSALMVIKAFSHWLPGFNVIEILHRFTGGPLATGWLDHVVIGAAIWGLLFALLYRRLPGEGGLIRGLVFSLIIWLAMMLLFLPIAGDGFFGVAIGWPAVGFTLGMHLVYGIVLGVGYDALS